MDEKKLDQVMGETAVAPRVTLAEVEANIKNVDYVKEVSRSGQVLRWCLITTQNGFAVTGRPGVAVSPLNDVPAFGEQVAFENAKNELWPLMGYELRTKLALIDKAGAPTGKICHIGSGVKSYVGTKVVHAVAMNLGEYNLLRGWLMPAEQDPTDEGYLVQYADGGKPNVPGFDGYISWSPKDVFEHAYSVGTTTKKSTHVDRMREEVRGLNARVEALHTFIHTNGLFKSLAEEEQRDMKHQLEAMREYRWFVERRLNRATK